MSGDFLPQESSGTKPLKWFLFCTKILTLTVIALSTKSYKRHRFRERWLANCSECELLSKQRFFLFLFFFIFLGCVFLASLCHSQGGVFLA
jgi:hypothetical protein